MTGQEGLGLHRQAPTLGFLENDDGKGQAETEIPFRGPVAHRLHDYFNEEAQAFIELEANGTGRFQFGYVRGDMDWRPGARDGRPAVTDGLGFWPCEIAVAVVAPAPHPRLRFT